MGGYYRTYKLSSYPISNMHDDVDDTARWSEWRSTQGQAKKLKKNA
jgi:hypothetical protein